MDKKNITIIILSILLTLIVGIFIGRGTKNHTPVSREQHRMPDGTMMSNMTDQYMQSMMHDMNASLEGKQGDVFDQEFLSEMIIHHEGAVAMAQKVLETSKRPELIKLAHDIISAQTGEIKMMNDWKSAWFK